MPKLLDQYVAERGDDLVDPRAVAASLDRIRAAKANREAVALAADHPVNREIVRYLNRLSSLLFMLARAEEAGAGTVAPKAKAPRS